MNNIIFRKKKTDPNRPWYLSSDRYGIKRSVRGNVRTLHYDPDVVTFNSEFTTYFPSQYVAKLERRNYLSSANSLYGTTSWVDKPDREEDFEVTIDYLAEITIFRLEK